MGVGGGRVVETRRNLLVQSYAILDSPGHQVDGRSRTMNREADEEFPHSIGATGQDTDSQVSELTLEGLSLFPSSDSPCTIACRLSPAWGSHSTNRLIMG